LKPSSEIPQLIWEWERRDLQDGMLGRYDPARI